MSAILVYLSTLSKSHPKTVQYGPFYCQCLSMAVYFTAGWGWIDCHKFVQTFDHAKYTDRANWVDWVQVLCFKFM